MTTNLFNVDICAAILADKAPQLPLREELNSLGFEVVLAAAGTGIRASKYESKKAVKKYRTIVATKDLKKRRLFPKSSRRIKETLAERRQMEHQLGLPHACSYETYDIKLRSGDSSSDSPTTTSDSCGSNISEKKLRWGMFQRRQRQSLKRYGASEGAVKSDENPDSMQHIANLAVFPDFLAPTDEPSEAIDHATTSSSSQHDVWKNAFDALDETSSNLAESKAKQQTKNDSSKYQHVTHLVYEANHLDSEGVPNPFGAFANMEHDLIPMDSGTTGVFDGLETDYQEESAYSSAADSTRRRVDPDGENIGSQRNVASSEKVARMKRSEKGTEPHSHFASVPIDLKESRREAESSNMAAHMTGSEKGNQSEFVFVLSDLKGSRQEDESTNMVAGMKGSEKGKQSDSVFENVPSDLRGGRKAVESSNTVTRTKGNQSDSVFETVPSALYANAGTYAQEEKKDDGINFDETFAIELAQSGNLKASKPEPKPFEDVSNDFYQAGGMGGVTGTETSLGLIAGAKVATQPASGTVVGFAEVQQQPSVEEAKPMSAFERATSEILKAAGMEADPIKTQVPSVEKPPEEKSAIGWITSAKNVFDNFSTEVLKVTGLDKHEQELPSPKNSGQSLAQSVGGDDISTLFSTLALPNVPPGKIERILAASPELPQIRRHQDGRLPLHALCDRGMPDRSSLPVASLTDYLLDDIASYKTIIKIVLDFYPSACLVQDKKEDLPVHLIARRVMEWEATWYEIVYQKAAKERDAAGATAMAITTLYQTMSETIEMLLRPLAENGELCATLCRAPGSMGTILPLHIASIFTVSVKCLRLILEAYPEAATIHCDLGILHTFIPDECLPLELHDNLSTDFPKWEIEVQQKGNQCDADANSEDAMRRSDLLFAYNPMEPHRLEKSRIRRIEARIQYDAAVMVGKKSRRLDRANERLWIWMCTFRERDTNRSSYVNSVKRVVSVLPLQSLRYLVSVKTEGGALLIDAANDECLKVIQRRLEQITGSAARDAMPSEDKQSDKAASMPHHEKEFVGRLCHLVFNVPVMPYPTSFIVLPYKLSTDLDGTLRLSSPEFTNVATKFAECLLSLTDPRSIVYMLDSKSRKHYGQSVFDSSANDDFHLRALARMNGFEDCLLTLYESGDAYLYLIDEATGLPRVDVSDTVYPIVLSSPASLVQKLVPLMMMGMVQMRGDKAIAKLASVILDERVAVVPPSWIEATDLLIALLESLDASDVSLVEARDSLRAFRSICPSKQRTAARPKNGITEWNAELSILKLLIEMNDPDRTFSGLNLPTIIETSVGPEEDSESLCYGSKSDVSLVPRGELKAVKGGESEQSSLARSRPEPDIIDLARKMDALSEMQHDMAQDRIRGSPVTRTRSPGPTFHNDTYPSPSSSPTFNDDKCPSPSPIFDDVNRMSLSPAFNDDLAFDDENYLIGNTFSMPDTCLSPVSRKSDASDLVQPRKHMISRYSILFDDFSVTNPSVNNEASDERESSVRVWNSVDRVWEDVTFQLNTRAETFCEDSQILQLKVALAEQARKLSELGKKVTFLKDEERRLATHETEIYDLTHVRDSDVDFATSDSLSDARRLVIRMGDLEERLICDEIQIQHLSMEAFSVEHEGEEMVTRLREPPSALRQAPWSPFSTTRIEEPLTLDTIGLPTTHMAPSSWAPRELSGISWGSRNSNVDSRSQRSFLRYEKRTIKVVRFDDALEEEANELEAQSSCEYSSNQAVPMTAIVIDDEYSASEGWQPILKIPSDRQSTPSTQNDSSTNSSRRDPEGSYEGQESRTGESAYFLGNRAGSRSEGIYASQDKQSNQAVADASNFSSDEKLSNVPISIVVDSTVQEASAADGQSSRTSEGSLSFQSTLLKILDTPTPQNNLHQSWSPAKDVRLSPMQTDDQSRDVLSRSQKLHAAKRKRFIPKLQRLPSDEARSVDHLLREQPQGLELIMEGNTYAIYDRVFPRNAATASVAESTGTGAASVFRPTKEITFNSQVPSRDLSALSCDNRSNSSDVYDARKVMEIEHLISKYTSEARGLSGYAEI